VSPLRLQLKDQDRKAPRCPACGNSTLNAAEVCSVCDKLLSEGFQPLDAIKSSHRMQRKRFNFPEPTGPGQQLFDSERSLASDPAFACMVYSMVPYIGIVFTPLAIVLGLRSYLLSRRRSDSEQERQALFCIGGSILVLGIQIFLWWLLYFIPESRL
jgi:hypothetical protein